MSSEATPEVGRVRLGEPRVRQGEVGRSRPVGRAIRGPESGLAILAMKNLGFLLEDAARRTYFSDAICQGPWNADLRTPPGQECSNGSLLRIAVVTLAFFKISTGAAIGSG